MADFKHTATFTGTEPISLDEAKAYLRVSTTADNAYITSLISTARETIEKDTNTALVTNSYKEYLDGFPVSNGGIIDLQVSGALNTSTPVSISYMGSDSVTHDITLVLDTDFVSGEFRGRPRLQPINVWATARDLIGSVKISYTIDPIVATELPLIQAMYLLISHFYDNRSPIVYGSVKEMPIGYKKLIRPYKNFYF
tara:strand:- start:1377 stop:1967 length:591 start_codon:yes stop_codon:yes gene_type:complete